MKAIGIICEYNPFHNGHLYHLNKIKKMFPNYLIILVLNGYFLERGEISIISKENKTKLALNYGVDLVVELPLVFGTQSADIFADVSLKILNKLNVEKIVFGSEINDIKKINDIATYQLNFVAFDDNVKNYLKEGINYPTAIAKAINLDFNYTPNDLLAISYIKSIIKNKYDIEPVSIKRTSGYHDLNADDYIVSATNIREKIKEKKKIDKYMPSDAINYLENINYQKLFELLKYKILTDDNLDNYLDVNEGIEYRLRKVIMETNNINDLIIKTKSKRFTYNKIRRMLVHILLGIKKSDIFNLELDCLHILGFNKFGKEYLNIIKKNTNESFVILKESLIYKYEIKAAIIYDLITNSKTYDYEKRNKPIIK